MNTFESGQMIWWNDDDFGLRVARFLTEFRPGLADVDMIVPSAAEPVAIRTQFLHTVTEDVD